MPIALVRKLAVPLLLAAATFGSIGSTSSAQAATEVAHGSAARTVTASNPDGCRGYVKNFYKDSGRVYMHYRVVCNRAQDRIIVTSFLRRGDAEDLYRVECRNVTFCTSVSSLADPAGSQMYFGRASEGFWPPSTAAVRGSRTVTCSDMTCGGAGKEF